MNGEATGTTSTVPFHSESIRQSRVTGLPKSTKSLSRSFWESDETISRFENCKKKLTIDFLHTLLILLVYYPMEKSNQMYHYILVVDIKVHQLFFSKNKFQLPDENLYLSRSADETIFSGASRVTVPFCEVTRDNIIS